jgi:hypothetical protein
MENKISLSTLIECKMLLTAKKENLETLMAQPLQDGARDFVAYRLREVAEALAEVEAAF